jgi:hypothetical protein
VIGICRPEIERPGERRSVSSEPLLIIVAFIAHRAERQPPAKRLEAIEQHKSGTSGHWSRRESVRRRRHQKDAPGVNLENEPGTLAPLTIDTFQHNGAASNPGYARESSRHLLLSV